MKTINQEFISKIQRRLRRVLSKKTRFARLSSQAQSPYIEPLCEFGYAHNIRIGDKVSFLRGAVVHACPTSFVSIEDGATICRFAIVQSMGGPIHIGKNTVVGDFCSLYGQGGLTIGDDVMIASGARFIPSLHSFDDPDMPISKQPSHGRGIEVGNGAWIGFNVCILDGVSIGAGAVVGAGSVVTHNVPKGAVAAGVPAVVLRYRPGYKTEDVNI